ncbi:hypothetical protein CDL12_07378 [Handroanthus impetiginosus]|uniref:Uncharacterized protein n=1 Tax=Handroanthus impetiginosus TaxID=429701 RepID=A0A2G9HQZ1_9LAMI|nr:hypothetical protein CDL12_07378 [Handroanthus impetiginosus]
MQAQNSINRQYLGLGHGLDGINGFSCTRPIKWECWWVPINIVTFVKKVTCDTSRP